MKRLTLAVALLALLGLAPGASAHQALPDPLTGTLVVPPGNVASLAIQDFHERDTLWVEYTVVGGTAQVSTLVRWVDAEGAPHEAAGSPAMGHAEFKFVAPRGLASATVEIANADAAEASVSYAYLSTAPFLKRTDLWIPTFAPFLLLGACVALAIAVRPWIAKHGTGPVRPPGWDEAQARKLEEKEQGHATAGPRQVDERRVITDDQV